MNPSGVVAAKTLPFKRKPVAAMIAQKPKAHVDNVLNLNKSNYLTDKHEQQARSYGKRWNTYQNHPESNNHPNSFLHAQAARYYAPNSIAERLPSKQEEKLSEFFNADLSAIRIHRDASARALAKREKANAFTAGAHIFFAPNNYDFDSEKGQSLLVHEITHVLQQTGRSTQAGENDQRGARLRATDITASGSIQRDYFIETAVDSKLFDPVPTLEEIKKAYNAETDYAKHAAILDKAVALPQSNVTIRDNLLVEIDKPDFKLLTTNIKAMYVDVLKHFASGEKVFQMLHHKAWEIMQKDNALPTSFRSQSFYEFVRGESLDWLNAVANADDFATKVFPNRFSYAYYRFFLSPDLIPIDLQANKQASGKEAFTTQTWKKLMEIRKQTGIGSNELQVMMLLGLYFLDSARMQNLESLVKRKTNDTMIDAIHRYARRFKSESAEDLSPSSLKESVAMFEIAFPSIKKYAKMAAGFWSRTKENYKAYKAGKGIGSLSEKQVSALIQDLTTDADFDAFRKALDQSVTNVFAATVKDEQVILPLPSKFAGAVETSRAQLKLAIASYVGRIAKLVSGDKLDTTDAIQLGLAVSILADAEKVLSYYDAGRDQTLTSKGLDDERRIRRIRYARSLVRTAYRMRWTGLLDKINRVFFEGVYIAIVSEWKEDPSADKLGDMSNDFKGELGSFEGSRVTATTIEQFFRIAYYDKVIETAQASLDNPLSTSASVLNSALKAANEKVLMPTRHTNNNWAYNSPGFRRSLAKDPKGFGYVSPSLAQLIFEHGQTKKYSATLGSKIGAESFTMFAPVEYFHESKPLYIWAVPNFDKFVVRLATINQVQTAVNTYLSVAGKPPITSVLDDPDKWRSELTNLIQLLQKQYEQTSFTDPKEEEAHKKQQRALLEALIKALFPNSKKSVDELAKQFLGTLTDDITESFDQEVAQKHDLAINKVRQATGKQLRAQLKDYDRSVPATVRYVLPRNVFAQIKAFAKFARSGKQELPQVTTLVLEIGRELFQALGPKENLIGTSHIRHYKTMDTLLTLVFESRAFWNKEKKAAKKLAKETPPAVHNRISQLSVFSYSELLARAAVLKKLEKSYKKRVIAEQKRKGLVGKKGTKFGDKKLNAGIKSVFWDDRAWTLIAASMDGDFTLNVGEGFELKGQQYHLQDVYVDFEFHPAFFKREDLDIKWPGRHRPGDPILIVDGKPIVKADNSNQPLLTYFKITPNKTKDKDKDNKKIADQTEVVTVTASDIGQLTRFSNTFDDRLGFDYMAGAGNLIETMATIELEVLELIVLKGGGKAAKAAIILAEILRFLASTDFTNIRDKLYLNPKQVMTRMESLLTDGAPGLINALLFDKLPFESHFAAPEIDSGNSTERRPRSRVAKLMKFVADRSEEALRSFMRLRGKVRGTFVATQSELLSHPMALRLIETIPELLAIVRDFSEHDLDVNDALGVTSPTAAKRTVEAQLQNIADSVLSFELPAEIIPTDLAVEVMLDFGLRAFGAKGKVLSEIVQAARADQAIGALIDSKFAKHDLNPNVKWRKEVAEKMQPLLQEVRDDLYLQLTALVSEATNKQIKLRPAKKKKASLDLDKDVPQMDALDDPTQDAEEERNTPLKVKFSGGERLPRNVMQQLNQEFGHDFGHVRIHRDDAAGKLTNQVGAHALTSGSHVFMNQNMNPYGSRGKQVLRHELAHVLQQTGSRADQDKHYSNSPTAGRNASGVTNDADLEVKADRMAQRAQLNSQGERTVPVDGEGEYLLQPLTMSEVAAKVLDELVDDNIVQDQAALFEQGAPSQVTRKATFKHAKVEAGQFWDKVKEFIAGKPANKRKINKPLNETSAGGLITEYLQNNIAQKVNDTVLSGIVMRSIKTTGNGRVVLKHKALAKNLETYVFAKSGLAMDIKLDTAGSKATKVTIEYLHPPYLNSNTTLFQTLKQNTLDAVKSATKKKLFTDNNGWSRVKKIIENRRHEKPLWHKKEFRYSDAFIEELIGNSAKSIEGLLEVSKDVKIDIWEDYADPKGLTKVTAGLRVATHGQLTNNAKPPDKNMPDSARKDRQSHHIPQYLLIEYFRGGHKTLAKNKNELLPGFIQSSSGSVKDLEGFSLTAEKGNKTIDFDDYDPNAGRGDNLPAISLAAVTHQRGRMHINAASSWDMSSDEYGAKGTQSMRIDKVFWDEVRSKTNNAGKSKAKVKSSYAGLSDSDKTQFRVNVHAAMKHTYKHMYDYMFGQLPKALVKHEIPYYKEVALALSAHHGYTSTDQLPTSFNPKESATSVADAVAAIKTENNNTIMSKWK